MFTIIIPVYNHLDNTKITLETLAETVPRFHLIIVDDGCTDGTEEWVVNEFSKTLKVGQLYEYIKNPHNLGVNASWNVGLRRAMELPYQHICIANNDLQFAPGWSDPLIQALDKKGYALVSPYSTEQKLPDDWPNGKDRHTNPVKINMLGACFMFNKSLIEDIGLFPEQMKHYFGDNWILDRSVGKGYGVSHIYDSYIHHYFCVTSSQLDNNKWFKQDGDAYLEYCKLPEPKPKQL